MKEFLLGIDIGSSALKMAIARLDGKSVAYATAAYTTYTPRPGWAEQNPNDWWLAICRHLRPLLRRAGIAASDIGGIGVDGYSWATVTIGKREQVLCNTPLWHDIRAAEACRRIHDVIGEEKVFTRCGNPIHPNYAMPKAMWYQQMQPRMATSIDKILSTNGFICYRLTGNAVQDISQAYGYYCFDVQRGRWVFDECEALGFNPAWLPPIFPCDGVIGTVCTAAARESGLHLGTPVVAGGLDAACGTLGAGVLHAGQTQEHGGQAGGISICVDRFQPKTNMIICHHVVPGQWLLQGGTVGGGGVMRWLTASLYPYETKSSAGRFQELDAKAAAIPAGSEGLLFLPYMAGERSPIWNEDAKGVFYGLDFTKGRGHLVRAALEGVAFSLRHNIEAARQPGQDIAELRSVGGAATSAVWMQIKADVTGKPIRSAGGELTTARGAMMLAGVGCGLLPDYETAAARFVALDSPYMPNLKNQPLYDEAYAQYLSLYHHLRPMMGG